MERKQTVQLARFARWAVLPFWFALLVGCGQLDMYDQAKYNPYEPNNQIFSANNRAKNGGDGAASRPLVQDTFARGQRLSSDPVGSGKDASGAYINNPIPASEAVVARGENRYQIYCAPCHGALGNGKGVAASYFNTAGQAPPSFYDPRLVNAEDGYLFEVITQGRGLMYPYASRVQVEDRWAIIQYIRSLQQNPPQGAIPPTPRPTAEGGAQPGATAPAAPAATSPAAPAATSPAATAAP